MKDNEILELAGKSWFEQQSDFQDIQSIKSKGLGDWSMWRLRF